MQKLDMRKLIFGGSAIVLALIAWTLYLAHDRRRFIESLPKMPPTLRHQPVGATEPLAPLLEDRVDQTTPGLLETATDGRATAPVDSTPLAEPDDPVFTEVVVEQMPKIDNTGLPSKLEVLFSAYHALYTESVEVSKGLSPLLLRHHSSSNRIIDIMLEELPNAPTEAIQQALYRELDELRAWEREINPTIFKLQDKRLRIREQRLTLLADYSFSSREEFLDTHREAYQAWAAKQTKQ